MQNANSSSGFFARAVHSCIGHPVLTGGAGRRPGLGQHACVASALWRPGLGTEAPKGHRASGAAVTGARAGGPGKSLPTSRDC